jgi:hypothetical protein
MRAEKAVMPDRFRLYAGAFTAAAVVGRPRCTAETLQPADQPPLPRNFLPAALYIHCATEGGDGPCAPDPAISSSNTLIDRPDVAPVPDPLDWPNVQPPR